MGVALSGVGLGVALGPPGLLVAIPSSELQAASVQSSSRLPIRRAVSVMGMSPVRCRVAAAHRLATRLCPCPQRLAASY